jgi:hypothetical protein
VGGSIHAGTGSGRKSMSATWKHLTLSLRRVNLPFLLHKPDLHQTSDRIMQIREAVARYDGCEFIPVRIQDAFDRGWWERVSGGPPSLSELPFDPSVGGGLSNLVPLQIFYFQIVELPIRFWTSFCSAKPPPCLAKPDGYTVHTINPDEIAIVIHGLFNRCFSSCPGHISHVSVDIPHLFDIARRWFCRTTSNTGRMGTTFR